MIRQEKNQYKQIEYELIFFKIINSEQFGLMFTIEGKLKEINKLKESYKSREEKLISLIKWLSENKDKAEESLRQEQYIKAQRAKAITSALLIGLASGVAAYGAYQSSRPQNIWLHDIKGNVYWGTIR